MAAGDEAAGRSLEEARHVRDVRLHAEQSVAQDADRRAERELGIARALFEIDEQHLARPAPEEGATRPDYERNHEFGEQRRDEPAGAEQFGHRVEQPEERREGEEVEDGAQEAELDHEPTDEAHVPAARPIDELWIYAVIGDADGRDVGEEVVEQDLAREERQERQLE